MKLNISFNELLASVRKMGITELVDFKVSFESTKIDIDVGRLNSSQGIEINLSDLTVQLGVLTHKGRQVLLFIPDHGAYFEKVITKQTEGNKFHLTDCATLANMREKGKFQRYHITDNRDGLFEINDGHSRRQEMALKVCKNCLSALNYKNYNQNRHTVFNQFSLAEFFENYETLFKNLPRENYQGEIGYADNWQEISKNYRASRHYCCEKCGVNLSKHPHLLHVHHKDGVKRNNNPNNLIALCKQCHINEPDHQHMAISLEESLLLQILKNNQGIY